jgi:hypothetical protein
MEREVVSEDQIQGSFLELEKGDPIDAETNFRNSLITIGLRQESIVSLNMRR